MFNQPHKSSKPGGGTGARRTQLSMCHSHLRKLPEFRLPHGYTLRHYAPGDEAAWVAIINASFGGQWTVEEFKRKMLDSPAFRPERIWFVCSPDGSPCATASAWHSASSGDGIGWLHMVGTHPDHAGRKLGYAVSRTALLQMHREGRAEARLQTDDHRVAAIKTYLRLGFEPMMLHVDHAARWKAILDKAAI